MVSASQGEALERSRIDSDSVGGEGSLAMFEGREGAATSTGGHLPGRVPGDDSGLVPDLSNTRGELGAQKGVFSAVSGGGEDWLQYLQHVDWKNAGPALFRILKDAKEKAQAGSGQTLQEVPGMGFLSVGRQGFTVGGPRGTYFEWRCTWRGLVLGFSERPGLGVKRHNFSVLADGEVCLLRGASHLVQEVRQLIRSLGGEYGPEELSRVDACVDLAGVPVAKFVRPFEGERFVSRCKSRSMFWGDDGQVTGFQVGKGASVLRVYDKLAELKSALDVVKLKAMEQFRWGGVTPAAASRVEWQLRREALQGHGVMTWDGWLEKRGAILADLMESHFRLVKGNRVERRHAETLPVWARAAAAFARWAGCADADLTPLVREGIDARALTLQAFGCLGTALLQRGIVPRSLEDLLRGVASLGNEYIDVGQMMVDLGRKAVALGVDEVPETVSVLV